MKIVPLGDSALLIRVTGSVRDLTQRIEALAIPGVIELVPAYESIGVFYEPAKLDAASLEEKVAAGLTNPIASPLHAAESRLVEIPVCYDAKFATDLHAVAAHTELSPAEVIARHSGAAYTVSCVGFTPGFAYLSGLPPELATPRRATPRKEVPAGAVAIGGMQTGVYPMKSPGGWNIIGRSPLRFFDLTADPPALLQPGDRVRFRPIAAEEFETG